MALTRAIHERLPMPADATAAGGRAPHPIGAAWSRTHAHLDDRTVVVAAQKGDALVHVDLVAGAVCRLLELTAPPCLVPLD